MTDDPVQEKYVEQMHILARTLDRVFNGDKHGAEREVGFALLVFDFNVPARVNYISNAERPKMLEAVQEWMARNK